MTREQKMNKRREMGKTYEYSPNPFARDSKEYRREQKRRAAKRSAKKLPFVQMKSIMAKLSNRLAKEAKRPVNNKTKAA